MTDQEGNELRVKVAELCGWRVTETIEGIGGLRQNYVWKHRSGREVIGDCNLPNYTSDLNACHEFEEYFDPTQRYLYRVELACMIGFSVGDSLWEILHSTAKQRCLAFIATMEKGEHHGR